MKIITHNEARRLASLFLEGNTSASEEQALYLYFSSGKNIPDDLLPLAPMFAWYESLPELRERKPLRHKKGKWLSRFSTVVSSAAAIAIILVTAITAYRTSDTRRDMIELQGSYIIRNGEKITDIASIYPELMRAEKMVENADERISSSDSDPLIEVALKNVSSPEARQALRNSMK